MLILISGANNSGKSAFAEQLLCRIPGSLYYLATMVCCTEENKQRISRHRQQRAGLGFTTIEEPCCLAQLRLEPDAVVLLEDVSNLLANAMFEQQAGAEQVLQDILSLSRRCAVLAAVTISGLSTEEYSGETAAYIRALQQLNRQLLAAADAAVQMDQGRPLWIKGGCHE